MRARGVAAKTLRLVTHVCRVADNKEPTCPQFSLSPLVKWSLATLGGAMVVHWVVKEARRINEELDSRQACARDRRRPAASSGPTLRRDPRTGEYAFLTRFLVKKLPGGTFIAPPAKLMRPAD